jgi:hypothetical protein
MIVHIASSKEEAESIEGATNIRPCRGHGESADSLWLYDTHIGLCVAEREMNGYNDSDFYMTVYISESDSFQEIQFATTRGWSYPCLASRVDATPEIMAKYEKHLEELRESQRRLREKRAAANPTKGKIVRVIRGRKHKDKEGRIFWRGVNKFRTYYRNGYNRPDSLHNQRIGIETEGGERFFVSADYVTVI